MGITPVLSNWGKWYRLAKILLCSYANEVNCWKLRYIGRYDLFLTKLHNLIMSLEIFLNLWQFAFKKYVACGTFQPLCNWVGGGREEINITTLLPCTCESCDMIFYDSMRRGSLPFPHWVAVSGHSVPWPGHSFGEEPFCICSRSIHFCLRSIHRPE